MERDPKPLAAAALSVMLPGAGHLYAGDRRLGVPLVAFSVLLALPIAVLGVLVLYVSGPRLALYVSRPFFERPVLLLVLLAVNVALLVFRLAVAVDAYLLAARGRRPSGRGAVAATALLAVLLVVATVAPHWWAGRRNLAVHDLLTHDFVTDPAAVTTTLPPETTIPPPTTTTPGTTGETTTTTSAPTSTTTSTSIVVTPTSIPSSPFEGTDRVNVLIMGGDAGPDRSGIRTDSMIVASIDPVSGRVALFGVPRNFKVLPVPDWLEGVWGCDCFEDQSNTIYQYGLQHPDLFPGGPNPGANAAKAVLGELLGLEIHFFALVDMLGFIDVIDSIGGVTITVTTPVVDEQYTHPDGDEEEIRIFTGTHHMDGETALAFARVRRGQSDYERMDRQRCVLEALVEQADAATVIQQLPFLVPAIKDSLFTDIPTADWPDIVEFLDRTDTGNMASIRFMPAAPELAGTGQSYIGGFTADRFGIPNVPLIQEMVQRVLDGDIETAGIPTLEEVCG
jgi:LCP family protein required for cell wall assembly